MSDFGSLAAQLRQAAAALEQATPSIVSHGAVIIKQSLQQGIAQRVGADMELTEGGGIPVNVRYRMNGQGPSHTATIRPTGASTYWVERGTQAHDINPRRKRGLAFGNATDDDQVRRRGVRHPGALARPFWRQRIAAAEPEARRAMAEDYRLLLESLLK